MDNMQLWLSSSTDSINLNDSAEGFYLNPDLEGLTGLPEIRSVNGLNAGYDGGWTATQLWAARLITIRGVIAINDKAAVETKRKALAKILSQGKNEDLELKFVSEVGNTYTTTVRTSYCTMALQRVFWRQEYQIQLRANDPLIYDDGGSELIAILRVMAGAGGFEIPFDIPFDIGGSITPTSIDVGDEATYPLIRLKGDLHSPTIINMTTNQRMQVLADIITTVEWHDYTTTYTTNGYKQVGDGLDGAPLSLTHLYGNATQETLSGKNLFDTSGYTIQGSGLTITRVSDGSFTLNGTTTGNVALIFTNNIPLNGDYTIITTGDALPVDSSYFNLYENADITGAISYYNLHSASHYKNFTFTGNSLSQRLLFGQGTYNNAKLYPMLVKGTYNLTNIGDYEPYCGGVPMPNPQFPSPVNVVSGAQTVKIVGKNLFDGNYVAYAIGGADGNLWFSSVTTRSAIIPCAPNTTYTVKKYGGNRFAIADAPTIPPNNTVVNVIYNNASMSQYTFTTSATAHYLLIYTTNDSTEPEMQLEIGNQATTYEPYQGQSYEINLGKNLFDKDNANIMASYISGSSGHAITAGNNNTTIYIPCEASTTYTVSRTAGNVFRVATTSTTPTNGMNTNGYIANDTGTSITITTGDSAKYLVVFVKNESSTQTESEILATLQIERGSVATAYAPYKTPLELAKIDTYQDYIYKSGDKWYIHKAINRITLKGTENWQHGTMFYCTDVIVSDTYAITPATGGAIMSDYFTYSGGATADPSIDIVNGYILRIRDTSKNDADAFKTWLSTHNTTVYYALATPTDTEITDADLIEQLNHIYSLYGGVNNLMLIPSAGAQGEMEVSYATAEDIDYHEVVIDCQARTVTQDGRNLYPALADGSEFIRLVPGENKLYLTSEVESDNGTAEVKFKKGNISI